MKPWVGEYPAKLVAVLDFNEILFDIELGFGLTLRQPVVIEVDDEISKSKKIFLKRKLENMLHVAESIFLRFYWEAKDDGRPIVDIDVNHQDLMDHLESCGFFSRDI